MSHTLRSVRERVGLTIAELARRAGVTERTIYRLERAETRPLLDTAIALEDALGVKRGSLVFDPVAPSEDAEPIPSPVGDRRRLIEERRIGGRRRSNREAYPDRRKAERR